MEPALRPDGLGVFPQAYRRGRSTADFRDLGGTARRRRQGARNNCGHHGPGEERHISHRLEADGENHQELLDNSRPGGSSTSPQLQAYASQVAYETNEDGEKGEEAEHDGWSTDSGSSP